MNTASTTFKCVTHDASFIKCFLIPVHNKNGTLVFRTIIKLIYTPFYKRDFSKVSIGNSPIFIFRLYVTLDMGEFDWKPVIVKSVVFGTVLNHDWIALKPMNDVCCYSELWLATAKPVMYYPELLLADDETVTCGYSELWLAGSSPGNIRSKWLSSFAFIGF